MLHTWREQYYSLHVWGNNIEVCEKDYFSKVYFLQYTNKSTHNLRLLYILIAVCKCGYLPLQLTRWINAWHLRTYVGRTYLWTLLRGWSLPNRPICTSTTDLLENSQTLWATATYFVVSYVFLFTIALQFRSALAIPFEPNPITDCVAVGCHVVAIM